MINLTLIGQMIAFAIFVWFTMKFVWPPLIGAVNERQQKIEEGLDAAKKARADLATAEAKIEEQFAAAKSEAAVIIERANKAANQMIEEAKAQASIEGERLIMQAHAVIESERKKTQEDLRRELAELVIVGVEKILQDSIDRQRHKQMIDDLAASLGSR